MIKLRLYEHKNSVKYCLIHTMAALAALINQSNVGDDQIDTGHLYCIVPQLLPAALFNLTNFTNLKMLTGFCGTCSFDCFSALLNLSFLIVIFFWRSVSWNVVSWQGKKPVTANHLHLRLQLWQQSQRRQGTPALSQPLRHFSSPPPQNSLFIFHCIFLYPA